MYLITVQADPKTTKGEKKGFLTGIVYLAPCKLAGRGNVCPWATPDCERCCLYSAGRGAFTATQEARIRRTQLFYDDLPEFIAKLLKEIRAFVKKAKRLGMKPAIRLNGTSDLPWAQIKKPFGGKRLMDLFPEVIFYDYTKNPRANFLDPQYRKTFSHTGKNWADCYQVLANGGNVAVVFRGELPAEYQGFPVYDGDQSDLRFLDPKGHVIGVLAKGKAKKDQSGFVVNPN